MGKLNRRARRQRSGAVAAPQVGERSKSSLTLEDVEAGQHGLRAGTVELNGPAVYVALFGLFALGALAIVRATEPDSLPPPGGTALVEQDDGCEDHQSPQITDNAPENSKEVTETADTAPATEPAVLGG